MFVIKSVQQLKVTKMKLGKSVRNNIWNSMWGPNDNMILDMTSYKVRTDILKVKSLLRNPVGRFVLNAVLVAIENKFPKSIKWWGRDVESSLIKNELR